MKHVLKASELRAAAKKNPDGSMMPLSELYADQASEKSKETGVWEGLKTFFKDANRDVKINGKRISMSGSDYKEGEKSQKFQETMKAELGIADLSAIDIAYSQNLQSIITHPLGWNNQVGITSGRSYSLGYASEDSGRENNIYREGDDVYYRVKIREYHVSQSFLADPENDGKNMLLPGPVEVLYKLVVDPVDPTKKVFALQHIATDSDFLKDVFLAKKEGLATQLKKELIDITPKTLLKNIDDLLKNPQIKPAIEKNQKLLAALADQYALALEALTRYEKSEISANQFVQTLETIKLNIGLIENQTVKRESFIKRHITGVTPADKPATNAIQKAIDNAKRLPAYQPVMVDAREKKASVTEQDESVVKIHAPTPGRSSAA